VGYEEIFSGRKELERIIEIIDYYRFNPNLSFSKYKNLDHEKKRNYSLEVRKQDESVKIYAFAAMPNHYHLLLKQLKDDGIKRFVSNIQNSFAKFYNLKNKRSGTLFRKAFKAKRIPNDEILLHVSRYIHLNPVTSYLIKKEELPNYRFNSFIYYTENRMGDLIDTEFLLKIAGSRKGYIDFVINQVDYQRKLHEIKSFLLEKSSF